MKFTGCNDAPPDANHPPAAGEPNTGFVLERGAKSGCEAGIEPKLAGVDTASWLPT